MMVQMIDPQPGERIVDPAAGTCGFLVNAWQHILETHTDPQELFYDDDGWPHGLTGSRLTSKEWNFAQDHGFTGYDSDSGMTMLRLGSMNLILHGLTLPSFHYFDTLSKSFNEECQYDVVLANPPFKGAIDTSDVNPTLPSKVRKTEILFLHLFLRLLENGGRAAVIVPDGILFGSTRAHIDIRKRLVEENRLEAVISMPPGVFRPYAGVSAAVLLFTKGAATERVWCYDMEHDGFSLDDRRQRIAQNDIPDLLACWRMRNDTQFQQRRSDRLAELISAVAPLQAQLRECHSLVNRLRFDEVMAGESIEAIASRAAAEDALAGLQTEMAPSLNEMNQISRQFWITKDRLRDNQYLLLAGAYRSAEREAAFLEKADVTLDRLQQLDVAMAKSVGEMRTLLADFND